METLYHIVVFASVLMGARDKSQLDFFNDPRKHIYQLAPV
jgi:hypothetical protein